MRAWWTAGLIAAIGYGVALAVIALGLPAGADLTGRFAGQPVAKAAMAVLLAVAALSHPIRRERRWLLGALLLSAVGDFFLAIPWWPPASLLCTLWTGCPKAPWGKAAFLTKTWCPWCIMAPVTL